MSVALDCLVCFLFSLHVSLRWLQELKPALCWVWNLMNLTDGCSQTPDYSEQLRQKNEPKEKNNFFFLVKLTCLQNHSPWGVPALQPLWKKKQQQKKKLFPKKQSYCVCSTATVTFYRTILGFKEVVCLPGCHWEKVFRSKVSLEVFQVLQSTAKSSTVAENEKLNIIKL